MKPPNESAWGDWESDLDVRSAHERFAGRSQERVFEMFGRIRNLHEIVDELRWTPREAFAYYFCVLADYIQTDEFLQKDTDMVTTAFLSVLTEKLEQDPTALDPFRERILAAAEFVGMRQARFDRQHTFENFGKRLRKIRRLSRRG